jgi:carbonic anhydrase/acetyltransferase-like protein (isoleucine patch superfamily)
MTKFDFRHHADQVDPTAHIAPGAVVLGNVTLGARSSVWFQAVIRGDTEAIQVGCESNIQDLALLHADRGVPCRLGDRVTVGHGAIVHGAVVEDEVLIGIRAVVLNGVYVGTGSIIGAGAVVPEGTEIPPGSIVLGVPGKVVGQATDEHRQRILYAAQHYVLAVKSLAAVDLAKEQNSTADRRGRNADEG